MDGPTLTRFRRNLTAWYARGARDLPWRRTHDPYRIWISEIMLQQTTVVAVIPYFERFLARFPDVATLAAAEEADVLRLWEGLGYYSRARNIHKAAKVVVAQHGGEFPRDVEKLHALPGIGRYTAGAIASFAFDLRAPIVEANTLRLYARLLAYRDDPRAAAGQKVLWEFAERVLPQKEPGRFNQALMELGATVCTPSTPACPECPAKTCCAAFAENAQSVIPVAAKRPEITEVTHAAVAVECGGRWLLRQCGPDERWAGLWDFPRIEVQDAPPARAAASESKRLRTEAEAAVERMTGISIIAGEVFHELRHTVTRYRIRLVCMRGVCRNGSAVNGESVRWVTPEEMLELPLSMTGRKVSQALTSKASRSPSLPFPPE